MTARHCLSGALVLATLSLASACTFDSSQLGECRNDSECATGRCVDRVCVGGSVDAGDDRDLSGPDDTSPACQGAVATCDDNVAVVCDERGFEARLNCDDEVNCTGDASLGCRCLDGACEPRVCEPSEETCFENDVIACDEAGGEFTTVETCGGNEVCIAAQCVFDSCSPGARLCIADVLVDCSAEGTLVVLADCALGERYCDAAALECVAWACRPGERRCTALGAVEVCDDRGMGFAVEAVCTAQQTCTEGVCEGEGCASGSTVCLDDETLGVCTDDGSYAPQSCPATAFCDDSGVVAECTEQGCAPGSSRCAAGREAVETCNPQGSGYAAPVACETHEFCQSGTCRPQVCTPSSAVCLDDDQTLRTCDSRGAQQTDIVCGTGRYCDETAEPDQCADQVCPPNELFCNEAGNVEQCDTLGSESSPVEDCDYACEGGVCQPPVCGDGFVTASEGETCDDENDLLCDGCEDCRALFALSIGPTTTTTATDEPWEPGRDNLTIEAWVFATSAGTLAGLGDPEGDYAVLRVESDGRPTFEFDMGSDQIVTATGPISIFGGWHHLAGIRFGEDEDQNELDFLDEDSAVLFVDGRVAELVRTDQSNSGIDDGDIWLGGIGSFTSAAAFIDEVRITDGIRYGREFAAPRRISDATDVRTVALFHLDEGAGGAPVDAADGARDVALGNAAWVVDNCYGSTDAAARCGDDGIAPWEDCDDGPTGSASCTSGCELPVCEDTVGLFRNCYLMSSTTETWDTAEEACVSWGGHLVTVDSLIEHAYMDIVFNPPAGSFWLGLNDIDDEDTFVWVADGSSPAYTLPWDGTEPNGGDSENCIEMYVGSGLWNDNSCSVERRYLCEK